MHGSSWIRAFPVLGAAAGIAIGVALFEERPDAGPGATLAAPATSAPASSDAPAGGAAAAPSPARPPSRRVGEGAIAPDRAPQAQGGDARDLDTRVRRLREDRAGAEAALRLDALDASRRAWAARMAAYRVERDRLLADPRRATQASLAELRALHFTPGEIPRVEGLDRIDGAEPRR